MLRVLRNHHTVEVEGGVSFPGTYVLPNRNAKLSDIINRAGGPTAYANEVATFIKRGNEIIAVDTIKYQSEKNQSIILNL